MFTKAYHVMQEELKNDETYCHHEIDYLLFNIFSKLSNPNYSLLEVGAFDGKCSIFFYENAIANNRQLNIIDNLDFIPNKFHNLFAKEIFYKRLKKINPQLEKVSLIIEDALTYNLCDLNPSFLSYDVAVQQIPNNLDLLLQTMPEQSIIVLSCLNIGFRPNYLKNIIELMNSNKLFLVAATNIHSFFTNSEQHKNEINNILINDPLWKYCKEVGLSTTPNVGNSTFHRFRTSFGHQSMIDYYKVKYS